MGKNLTEKILCHHNPGTAAAAGSPLEIRVDQVLLQDHTGTQALLHFEAIGLDRIQTELAVCYADHNVLQFQAENMADHLFLQSACSKYGLWFGKPGTGICHQVHLERFSAPGKVLLGADSHTPHCGGVGMLALGAGGLDVAATLATGTYCLHPPKVVRVHLVGELEPWSSAKDIALELLNRLGVRGGRRRIFEFAGPGIRTLRVQERVTITNMCTELGATTGIFPSDEITREYLRHHDREQAWRILAPDPAARYDEELEIDLGSIEPLVATPGQPDNVVPVAAVGGTKIQQVMVGSCTNGSYFDLQKVAQIVRGHEVHPEVMFFVHPSSSSAVNALSQGGQLADLLHAGVEVAQSTCGACIGIGHVPAPGTRSLRAINRNFPGRSGLEEDSVYLSSAETAAVSALVGEISDPREVAHRLGLDCPRPDSPAPCVEAGLVAPAPPAESRKCDVIRGPHIARTTFREPLRSRLSGVVLLLVGDDVSTDEIMPASLSALSHRSNIPAISQFAFHRLDPNFGERAESHGGGWIVAGYNYGQGSSREHAALALMHLGIHGVIAKSYARIHENNLVNAGILPLVFDNVQDYDALRDGMSLEFNGVRSSIRRGRLSAESLDSERNFHMHLDLSSHQREVLKAGGLISFLTL